MHSNSSVLSLGDFLSFLVKDFVSQWTILLVGCHSNAFFHVLSIHYFYDLHDFLLSIDPVVWFLSFMKSWADVFSQ